jgi:hypothetical protein
MTEQFPLRVGTILKIMPEHSARDYDYIVLDALSGKRADPFRVAIYDAQKAAFVELSDQHHLLQFRQLSDPWRQDQIFTCINDSVHRGTLSTEDATKAVTWYYEGASRPPRTFSRSEILITTRAR